MDDQARQQILDHEHLKLLRIGYFVIGGLSVFGVAMGFLYGAMGLMAGLTTATMPHRAGDPAPAFLSFMFVGMGCFILIFSGSYVVLAFLTAQALGRRKSRTLCLITAAISCLHIPFGTLLGVFTFIVLGRPTVQALWTAGSSGGAGAGGYAPPPMSSGAPRPPAPPVAPSPGGLPRMPPAAPPPSGV